MKRYFTNSRIAWLIVASVLLIDQLIKVLVKTQMYWHESIRVTDWFYIFLPKTSVWHLGWR